MTDSDPSVYLRPGRTTDITEQMRMFDAKKWLWLNDEEECFKAAFVKSQKGDKMVVELSNGSEVTVDINATQQMNPPKFEKIEDMASLTYLNEASVLHNLRQRYYSSLIYTYSGLFCVAINPYRMLPVYTKTVIDMYRGKRKTEMPPHIFAVADNAYHDMLQDQENQSILITGESGAGKTENTKKVIQYFAVVAPSTQKQQTNLEDQVIQANPVLEAFGNAKTIRNDNSSRFGKFIRVHFGNQGKISGADIEFYLLEKSRVIHQQAGERSYHIFYQIMAGASQDLLNKLLLKRQPKSYSFLANSELTVDNVDDSQMFKLTQEAMETLSFTEDEQMFLFKVIAGVLHFGNIEVKQRPREEWATIPTAEECDKVSHILGISSADLMKALIKPRIRVGNEYVQQGRNMDQVKYSIGALSKSLYERMFRWLVSRVNKTLDTKTRKNFFIGVLDIAGFEIFKLNSFEQLCINYTNERLQQFFNHHMFVLEQEEYRKEGINWEFIDFGLDLQPCIDLIEKPLGIFSILDEECLFPKASDQSFINKLNANHADKSPNYIKAQFKTGGNTIDFEVAHYAGTVGYTAAGWLDKNKDPLNDNVVELLKKSTDPGIASLWNDYLPEGERKGKGSQFVTMAHLHKQSLNNLMTTLGNTTPHFVRCIIPNEMKRPGVIDAHLVLHQLRCNGVLEGIRICRKGFPNRLLYQEFRQRYIILAPKSIPAGFMDGRKATEALIEALQLENTEYRLGHSKVFFRAGVLGRLEDMRDERLSIVLTQFQSFCRGYSTRKTYRKLLDQRLAIAVIQRNVRKHLFLRDWKWWKLYTKVKPLLNVARTEDELRQKEEELNKMREKLSKEEQGRKALEDIKTQLMEEKNQLFVQLQREHDACAEAEENLQRLLGKKTDLEAHLQELVDRLDEEVENNANISAARRKVEAELEHHKESLTELKITLEQTVQEKAQKEKDCATLDAELEKVNESLSRTNKEKTSLEERLQELTNSLQNEEDKANRLSKLKIKLESTIQETHDELQKEKVARGELEKAKRKVEADLKSGQDALEQINRSKAELEKSLTGKDKEIADLVQKVEEDQSQVAALQRRIRELEARIEELEEDLENERSQRQKAEKQKADLTKELETLQDQLEEEGGAKTAQLELNKKREVELVQLRKDQERVSEDHEKVVADLRKKHAQSVGELEEKVDSLQKAKAKLEKEKASLSTEGSDLVAQVQQMEKTKVATEKRLKQLEEQNGEISARLREYESTIATLQAAQAKAQSENAELLQQATDAESKIGVITKAKNALEAQLDEAKAELESESNSKADIMVKLKAMESELNHAHESIEEEQEGKTELQKQLTATKNDAAQLRARLDNEATPRIEELEDTKRKLQNKLKEAEEALTLSDSKYAALDKTKTRIATELEDLHLDLEKERSNSAALENKQKKIDQQITEWRSKYESKQAELENAQKEARNYSTEVLKLKGQYDELHDQLEAANKENKHLQGEISDLEKQLSEGGSSVHDLEKAKRKLEQEKEELTQSLEDAEGQLEGEQQRVLRIQLELTQLKQETERKLAEKDGEMESLRKNHGRQQESLQQSLEEESKAKNEQIRLKKVVEGQIDELQATIDAGEKAASDNQKKIKALQQQVKEITSSFEEEQRLRSEDRDLTTKAEKRANDLQREIEELRVNMEQKSLRNIEAENADAQERLTEANNSKTSLVASKRKVDQQLATLQGEYEELESEGKENSEKLRKATELVVRYQSEVMAEKEAANALEKARAALDQQVKDLTARLGEEVANATKSAKKEAQKLQARITELEGELETETKGKGDAQRNLKRLDRRVKEVQAQMEEEKAASQRLQEQINSLNAKAKTLRREKEDTEGELEAMRTKNRQLRSALDESEEEKAGLQAQLSKARTTTTTSARKGKPAPVDADDDK
ncbi:hypothetical protein EMCRGX_G027764 [Ephydatia muelleri]